MIEVRFHGRGGQGAVTSAEMAALAAIAEGKYAQAFPSFGPERRGAPVLAFVRVNDKEPIKNRAGITEPDVVVVLDPSLLGIVDVAAGLRDGGTLIINTRRSPDEIKSDFGMVQRLATVDATAMAKEILGVPITNTSMLGALVKATQIVRLESLEEPLRHRFGRLAERNINVMKKAYEETVIKEGVY
ncbi:MAG: pyruvate ferredoxin oxidoreductase subunit gamma [Chloroflexota bacterium]